MANKERERFYIRRLWESLPSPPTGQIVAGESPDFRVATPEGWLGIEVTSFYYPPRPKTRPHQEVQALKQRVIDQAERLHAAAGGPAVYVQAIFNERVRLTKVSVPYVARRVADAVRGADVPRSAGEPSVDVPRAVLPDEVPHVRVHGSVDGEDKLWTADALGWVETIRSEHVQEVITKKMGRASIARASCTSLWLVIVHDLFAGGAAAELTPHVAAHSYNHAFDRVFWLDPHLPRAIDLYGRRALANEAFQRIGARGARPAR